MDHGGSSPPAGARSGGGGWSQALLFGTLAFFQGFNEPTEGLMAQPVRSLLSSWGQTASEITRFAAVLALPWILKPVFGLVSDLVPLGGSRRRVYLILTGAITAGSLLGLFAFPPAPGSRAVLLGWLLIATAAVAFADVAADGLLVDQGQPSALSGRFQAIQWAGMYAAGLAAGLVGGELSARHLEHASFLVCGLGATASLGVVVLGVREPRAAARAASLRQALGVLAETGRSPVVLGVAGFLFLWNFNPFSNAVLHLHMTRGMGLDERFFGRTLSLSALASIAASLAYSLYCRRIPFHVLVHASIALGVVSTLAYLGMTDKPTAVAVSLATGFSYMTATLIQLDLAARHCPPGAAGTTFALLMAAQNLAAIFSIALGGQIYEHGQARWGSRTAFQVLVLVGSALTASCWLLVRLLPRAVLRPDERAA
jgi:MFS family permease